MSPAMVATAAIKGEVADVRELLSANSWTEM
jgi:3-isopropylmalate/(R)-2-methylmalate dehydratase large subunit